MRILLEELVKTLKLKHETISCMESCTGGFLTNEITNTEGSSDVLKVSLVTYSNEYKIKFGVNENTIKKHTEYSLNTSMEMAKKVSNFAKSNWGVGITRTTSVKKKSTKYIILFMKAKPINFTTILFWQLAKIELIRKNM